MNTKPVVFNNTVLRDGHQSLAATRMSTAQMTPVVAALDGLGFGALETWGGATIDSCLRFLDENPFDRLDALKALSPKTPHMMLLRGQNIVQYTSFPDDVVEAFVASAAKHGMDIFRVFDALNDTRNLETCIRAVHKAGKHAQGTICYTISPVHTLAAFVQLGVELQAMGCDSVCIKDMAGLISPTVAAKLVKALKEKIRLPIVLHTHSTAGLGAASYFAAIEAGVDFVDTSVAPFADTLEKLRQHFAGVYGELSKFTSPANERVDTDILRFQVPGGMLSNFRNQLKEQNMADKLDEVLEEIPKVRESLGWIPLVTPTSQIVGTQAMLNVKFGRWKMFSQPAMDIVLGKYGKTPGPVDPELKARAVKESGQALVECRPADLLEPRMDKLRAELASKGLPVSDEIAVCYAMFPHETEKLLKPAPAKAPAPEPAPAPATPAAPAAPPQASAGHGATHYALNIRGGRYEVTVEEIS
jgi:oxaloacetate decarboxylase alpha subunit/pyruvate carboxylase subunit B